MNPLGTFPKQCFWEKIHKVLPMSFTRRLTNYRETLIARYCMIAYHLEEGDMKSGEARAYSKLEIIPNHFY